MARRAQNAAAVPAQNPVNVLAQFHGLQPATFNGQGDPRIVEEWIRSLEQLFEAMNCTEQERIQCAQLQMIGDAGLWWFSYWQIRTVEEKQALTWFGFKQIVKEKYYPSYYRAQMEREFLDMEQEERSVDEYEREFTRLAFFVPYLVDTDEKRARRFRDGLRDVIRNHLAGHGELSYVETVSRAQQIDASIKQKSQRVPKTTVNPPAQPLVQQMPNQQANAKNKRKWKAHQDERRNLPRGQGQAGQQPQQVPNCGTCGKPHRGECLAGRDICYNCRKPNHNARNCPDRRQNQQGQQQQTQNIHPQARQANVYALNQAEVEEHSGTMSGILILNNVPVFALFDTGATHSFVLDKCLEALTKGVSTIDPLEISLASGKKIVTNSIVKNLNLSIGGKILEANASVIEMRDFDLILGMD
ncbi:Unknown protein, partial [Striga hermonthica]